VVDVLMLSIVLTATAVNPFSLLPENANCVPGGNKISASFGYVEIGATSIPSL
jgi:hypothetical protein